LHNKLILFLDI